MRVLVLDCALPCCRVALLDGATVLAERVLEARHGQASLLPGVVAELLAVHGRGLDRIVANVGPGSFTGLRVALSLAHGLALAGSVALVGVTGGEALAGTVAAEGRALWVATPARAGRVFLECDGVARTALLDALPAVGGALPAVGGALPAVGGALPAVGGALPAVGGALPAVGGALLVAGAAAAEVAQRLAARGEDVRLGPCHGPDASALAAAAQRRVEGGLPPRAVLPLYVDAPEASLPRGGLRPGPA